MLVFAALMLKLAVVAALARWLRARCADALGAWLAAWTIATAAAFAAIFALSAAQILDRGAYWIVLGAGGALSAITLRRGPSLPEFIRAAPVSHAAFAVLWLALAARALVFTDFTWDAQTYGLARIGLWMNHGSVFIHMPTIFVNVIANEWNGELLGLFYALAGGDLQAPLFGTIEVVLVGYLACARLARLFGASWPWAFAVSALCISWPVCLGVATTVKGDFLAACGFVLALGWLVEARERQGYFPVAMLAATLALAAGAKIMATVAAVALALAAAIMLRPRRLFDPRAVAIGGGMAAIFLARYIVNFAIYGDPLHRPAGEAPEPALRTFLANLDMIWQASHAYSLQPEGPGFSAIHLTGGLGVAGFALAAAIIILVVRRVRVPALLLAILVIGLLVSCIAVPARIYGFRYFLPWILGAGIILLALAEPPQRRMTVALVLALAGANAAYLFFPGEMNGARSFAAVLPEVLRRTPIEQAYLPWEGRRTLDHFDALRFEREESLRIALYQAPDHPLLPYLGSRAQHRVRLVEAPADLGAAARAIGADLVIATKRGRLRINAATYADVVAAGYVWIADNMWVAIAARVDRPEAKSCCAPAGAEAEVAWRSGAHGEETHDGTRFRWLQARAELDVPLAKGRACLEIDAFAAGTTASAAVLAIEGGTPSPRRFALAGATMRAPRRIRIAVRGEAEKARLRFEISTPEIRFPGDPRAIAFGVRSPPLLLAPQRCE